MVRDRASKLARGFVFDTLKDNDSATCPLFNAKWPTGPLDISKLPLLYHFDRMPWGCDV